MVRGACANLHIYYHVVDFRCVRLDALQMRHHNARVLGLPPRDGYCELCELRDQALTECRLFRSRRASRMRRDSFQACEGGLQRDERETKKQEAAAGGGRAERSICLQQLEVGRTVG